MNTTKKCNTCNITKDLSSFHKDTSRNPHCKECSKEINLKYDRTLNGVIRTIYATQRLHSKRRGYALPNYTKQEFKEWVLRQDNFNKLWDAWVNSGYRKSLKPSPDRNNDYLPYSLDILTLMTFGENRNKAHKDRVKGRNNKCSKAVNQFTLGGELVAVYHSGREAGRRTGVSQSHIGQVCRGEHKQAGGFKWEYSD